MNRRHFLKTLGAGGVALSFSGCNLKRKTDKSGAMRPNIVIILADDMGFSDLGCYGGEIDTPHLNRLAEKGIRFTQFYNTARCCPSRASLLTGLYPHQVEMGHMTFDAGFEGYRGNLSLNSVTIAEVLSHAGYRTYMSGKWHVSQYRSMANWPLKRGIDDYYGIIEGACSYFNPSSLTRNNQEIKTPPGDYYLTDAITDEAVRQILQHKEIHAEKPFFLYLAYTAPHWPLHAREEDIKKYEGRFDKGWDKLREERLARMIDTGLIESEWQLSPRDPSQPPWDEAEHKEWQVRRMEVYAAQVDCMDRGIGRIVNLLRDTGHLDNTLILFLSDNGGCAEELVGAERKWLIERGAAWTETRDGKKVQIGNDPGFLPGGEETYQSYGIPWANLSNTPFREYKHWVHEGGIATPLIVHWPTKIKTHGGLSHEPAQLPDIMATCLEVAGADYPDTYQGRSIIPHEGYSLVPLFYRNEFKREALFWEHEGNRAVRQGKWKLVSKFQGDWELYDMEADRTELNDLSHAHPELVEKLSAMYEKWAVRCSVRPWSDILDLRRARREQRQKKKSQKN